MWWGRAQWSKMPPTQSEVLSLWRSWQLCIRLLKKQAWRGGINASLLSQQSVNVVLLSASVNVGNVQRRVLVDTGCSMGITHMSCCKVVKGCNQHGHCEWERVAV
ncbi:hypothetical protein E2C01_042091 [Portunus trituberculatus]|uniref:Uncharacterized protein n=1 Tax=Portunus trituberculatus TaxID=210409 RepID=A0A5B7FTP5_PORTR|nr:hypothetical protein [Portunus trituberculatus]